MTKQDLFNEDSICIFTDSSFKNCSPDKRVAIGYTAPAYCVYNADRLVEQGFHILQNSTSQKGELYALNLGVNAAFRYRNFKHLRIFSDSMNSIFAIRERIFNWVLRTNNGGNVLGPEGTISNQDYIMNIVYDIIENRIPIEFYHVKGHVNVKKYGDVMEARRMFETSNLYPGVRADDELIYQIALGNDMVDRFSTSMLHMHCNDPKYNIAGLVPAVSIGYAPFDMNLYSYLVNSQGKEKEVKWIR